MKVEFKGLKKLSKQLNGLKKEDLQAFNESAIKDLAAYMLANAIKETPVGDYSREIKVTAKRNSKKHKKGDVYTKRVNSSGKKGGTLRRGWTVGEVIKSGNGFSIDIINPVEYASYVEFGHRKVNNKGWVEGSFMLTKSEQELEKATPRILENRLNKILEGLFDV